MSDQLKHTPKDPDRLQFTVDQEKKEEMGYDNDEDFLDEERTYCDKVKIPVLPSDTNIPGNDRLTVLLGLYSEICSGWRALTEVRFKLLGLLPLASVALLVTIFSKKDNEYSMPAIGQIIVALFGLVVTIGLMIYDRRNSGLYNDLIGRGRQLESELGVHTGHFRGRPKSKGIVKHDIGLGIVYVACVVAWLYLLGFGYVRFCLNI